MAQQQTSGAGFPLMGVRCRTFCVLLETFILTDCNNEFLIICRELSEQLVTLYIYNGDFL